MYQLRREVVVDAPIGEVWEFFSNPKNLQKITPSEMNFDVLSGAEEPTYAGQVICYKVNILPLVRVGWVTEITHVKEKAFFVDEQRFGPYRFWHHQHHFVAMGNRTKMVDIVHYKLPMLPFTGLVNKLFICKQLNQIFNYRTQQVDKLFGVVEY